MLNPVTISYVFLISVGVVLSITARNWRLKWFALSLLAMFAVMLATGNSDNIWVKALSSSIGLVVWYHIQDVHGDDYPPPWVFVPLAGHFLIILGYAISYIFPGANVILCWALIQAGFFGMTVVMIFLGGWGTFRRIQEARAMKSSNDNGDSRPPTSEALSGSALSVILNLMGALVAQGRLTKDEQKAILVEAGETVDLLGMGEKETREARGILRSLSQSAKD